MSELSPIDLSVVELLSQSRLARDQEISDRAKAIHDASVEVDQTLTVEGLLLKECQNLKSSLLLREKYYLDANWFQKLRLRKFGRPALSLVIKENGREVQPTKFQERVIRKFNIKKGMWFSVSNLLPTEPEMTDTGRIYQDWSVTTEPFFINTFLVTKNHDRDDIVSSTHIYKIGLNGGASVYENGNQIEDDDLFLPLGIVIAAHQNVKNSVPRGISKNW